MPAQLLQIDSAFYANTSSDCKEGYAIKGHATQGYCDLAAATTDIPWGVAAEDCVKALSGPVPVNAVSFFVAPGRVKMVCGAAITANGLLVADSTGRFIIGTKGGTQTQTDFCWGRSVGQTTANAGETFWGYFNWFEMEVT